MSFSPNPDSMAGMGQFTIGRKPNPDLSPGGGRRKMMNIMGVDQQKPVKKAFYSEDDDAEASMYFNNQNWFRSKEDMMSSPSPSQLSNFSSGNFYSGGPPTSAGGNLNIGNLSSNLSGNLSGGISLAQRGMSGNQFPRNNMTPTSIGGTNFMGGSNNFGASSIGGTSFSGSSNAIGNTSLGVSNINSSNIGSSLNSNMGSSSSGMDVRIGSIGGSYPVSMHQQQSSPSRAMFSSIGSQRNFINQNSGNIQQQAIGPIQKRNSSISSVSNSNYSSNSGYPSFSSGRSQGAVYFPDQPSLDLSEFPTLGNRSVPSNPVPSSVRNFKQESNWLNICNKPASEQQPEFSIQQEDFPALPGSSNPPKSTANDIGGKSPTGSGANTYEQAVSKDGKLFNIEKSANSTSKRTIQTHADGTVSNIPMGMVTDQFGMVGLLTFIRAAEKDPNLVALAPGIDLTTLGLNLNSPEPLYTTFQSPWADSPCRPQDIDFHVPSEYLTNAFIREKLAQIKLNRYGDDLLFFLFYMYGGDVLQLASSAELYSRDWRYHKEERVWITRVTGIEPVVKTNSYERGTYFFFDVQNWRKITKEFHLEYDKLEERPLLPHSLHNNPSQTILAH